MNITAIKKILRMLGVVFIKPNDTPLIRDVKSYAVHTERSFWYGLSKRVVDSIYCHASPGTFETVLVELEKVNNRQNKAVLNLGGGSGQVSSIIERLGFVVTNVDIELEKEDQKNIRFDLNSEMELSVPKHSFDIVICQEIIEHVENPWKLFRFAHMYLKPGGVLYLTTPNIQSRSSKLLFLWRGYFQWFGPESLSYHINPLPIWEIELIGNKTGFTLLTIKGSGEYYFGRTMKRSRRALTVSNETLIFVYRA